MIIKILTNGLAVFLTAMILPGIHVSDYLTAILVGIVLSLINTFIKPIIQILTLPITILSLGLWTFVINAIVILLADYFVKGFYVENFGWALLFSFLVSIISSLLNNLLKK